MAKLVLRGGKPMLKDGKLVTKEACCCGTCPPANPCTLDFHVLTDEGYEATESGLLIPATDCFENYDGPNWASTQWTTDPTGYDPVCGRSAEGCRQCDPYDDPEPPPRECSCAWTGFWRKRYGGLPPTFAFNVSVSLNRRITAPAGWYLSISVSRFVSIFSKTYTNCSIGPDWLCSFLGSDDSVFASDLNISLVLNEIFGTGGTANFDITFHPC